MTDLQEYLYKKLNDCERIFEKANTNADMVFMKGLLKHGGETNALLMNIGKRQAYQEILDYLRNGGKIE